MGAPRVLTSANWSDVAGLLLTLRPGTYSFRALVDTLTAQVDHDVRDLLERALAEGFLTVLAAHVVDSDGHDVDDRLVMVDPAAVLSSALPLPTGPALDIQPLSTDLIVPAVPPLPRRGSRA
jgi:hypothetical protein